MARTRSRTNHQVNKEFAAIGVGANYTSDRSLLSGDQMAGFAFGLDGAWDDVVEVAQQRQEQRPSGRMPGAWNEHKNTNGDAYRGQRHQQRQSPGSS